MFYIRISQFKPFKRWDGVSGPYSDESEAIKKLRENGWLETGQPGVWTKPFGMIQQYAHVNRFNSLN